MISKKLKGTSIYGDSDCHLIKLCISAISICYFSTNNAENLILILECELTLLIAQK